MAKAYKVDFRQKLSELENKFNKHVFGHNENNQTQSYRDDLIRANSAGILFTNDSAPAAAHHRHPRHKEKKEKKEIDVDDREEKPNLMDALDAMDDNTARARPPMKKPRSFSDLRSTTLEAQRNESNDTDSDGSTAMTSRIKNSVENLMKKPTLKMQLSTHSDQKPNNNTPIGKIKKKLSVETLEKKIFNRKKSVEQEKSVAEVEKDTSVQSGKARQSNDEEYNKKLYDSEEDDVNDDLAMNAQDMNHSSFSTFLTDYALKDVSIITVVNLIVCYISFAHVSITMEYHVPLHVAFSWVVLAFSCGYVLSSRLHSYHAPPKREVTQRPTLFRQSERFFSAKKLNAKKRTTLSEMRKSVTAPSFPEGFWTSLSKDAPQPEWQQAAYRPVAKSVMQRLMKYEDFRRVGEGNCRHSSSSDIANRDLTKEVDPITPLRGFDAFVSDFPQMTLWNNRLLQRCGLRKVPTFIANCVLPFGNIVVHLELPSWVKKFDDITEEESDAEDTKALKRFLKGDDDYRNNHFKIFPSLVTGPLAIRMIAPKRDLTIHGTMLPLTWVQKDEYTDKLGNTHAAILEMSCDVVSDSMSRRMAQLLRRYIESVSFDITFALDRPDLSPIPEPAACLAMFRMHKIDLFTCPLLPPPSEKSAIQRASVIASSKNLLEEGVVSA